MKQYSESTKKEPECFSSKAQLRELLQDIPFELKVLLDDDPVSLKFLIAKEKNNGLVYNMDDIQTSHFVNLLRRGRLESEMRFSDMLPTYGNDSLPMIGFRTKMESEYSKKRLQPDFEGLRVKEAFEKQRFIRRNVDLEKGLKKWSNPNKSNSSQAKGNDLNGPFKVHLYKGRDWVIPKPPAGWIWPGWTANFYFKDSSQMQPNYWYPQNDYYQGGLGFLISRSWMPWKWDDTVSSMWLEFNTSGFGYNPQRVRLELYTAPYHYKDYDYGSAWDIQTKNRQPWFEYKQVVDYPMIHLNGVNALLRKLTNLVTWHFIWMGNFDNELSSYKAFARL